MGVLHVNRFNNVFFVYIVLHQFLRDADMATGSKNAKSQSVTARIAHQIIDGMEKTKVPGESTGQFLSSALQGEIKRRQRKQSRDAEPKD